MLRKIAFILITSCLSVFAVLQFELKNYITAAENTPEGDQARSDRLWNLSSELYSLQAMGQNFSWYLHHRFDGSTIHMALPERTIPLDNHTALGIRHEDKTLFQAGVAHDVLSNAKEIRPYYLESADDLMTQQMLSNVNLSWDTRGEKVTLLMYLNYYRLNYTLHNSLDESSPQIDDDAWGLFNINVHPSEAFNVDVGSLTKLDFKNNSDFNYNEQHVGIGGIPELKLDGGRKLIFEWYLAERYRRSDAVYYKGDAVGFATEFYAKPVLKLRKKFFLKGAIKLDLSEKMKKQWYEMGIRKVIKNNLMFDCTYWNVAGSYFPRQGLKSKIAIYMGPIGLVPEAQFFWRRNRDTDAYTYYRTTASMELMTTINRVDIFGGYGYSYFNDLQDVTPFVSRGSVYFGVRKW